MHSSKLRAGGLVDASVVRQDIDHLQSVSLSKSKIVGIMGRSDLHTASSKLLVDVRICNDAHVSVWEERVNQLLPNQVHVPSVLGMDSDRHIAQHRLETSGCDGQKFVFTALNGVLEGDNDANLHLVTGAGNGHQGPLRDLFVLDLQVRQRRAEV